MRLGRSRRTSSLIEGEALHAPFLWTRSPRSLSRSARTRRWTRCFLPGARSSQKMAEAIIGLWDTPRRTRRRTVLVKKTKHFMKERWRLSGKKPSSPTSSSVRWWPTASLEVLVRALGPGYSRKLEIAFQRHTWWPWVSGQACAVIPLSSTTTPACRWLTSRTMPMSPWVSRMIRFSKRWTESTWHDREKLSWRRISRAKKKNLDRLLCNLPKARMEP